MQRRRVLELIVVGLWLAIAAVLFIKYSGKDSAPIPESLAVPTIPDAEKGKKYDVRKIVVIRGDSFDITIKDKDNSRIMGKLSLMSTDNAKEKVIDLLNHSNNPQVILREKQSDGRWTIDLIFVNEGKDVNLVQWLVSNNLVYK